MYTQHAASDRVRPKGQNRRTYDLGEMLISDKEIGQEDVQPAKIPFLPLLEKVAEKFVL